jgi:hypothetical protein
VYASLGLFLTLFLPWYQETVIATTVKAKNLQSASESLTGWAAFSFVEAAVLVVAVSVLVLLFYRAEGRAFHLPGGDGWVITAAGAWTCFLIVWRMFDKQGTTSHGQYASTAGIEWGIFVALFVAALLTYAGTRIRAAHQPEPPLPTEGGAVFDGRWHSDGTTPQERTARAKRPSRKPPVPAAGVAPAPGSARVQDLRPKRSRSSWRPSDTPEWSGPSRPAGWLTSLPDEAPVAEKEELASSAAADVLPPDTGETAQLSIPLDDDA